jgi:predicted transcriptional regulator
MAAAAAFALPSISLSAVRETAAEEIARRMDALNVGQQFIADYCHLSQTAISRFLSGERDLTVEKLSRVKAALRDLETLVKLLPAKPEWDIQSIPTLVEVIVHNPEMRSEMEKSMERFRMYAGLAALRS